MLAGVYEIIPREYLTIFDEKELELLLCGSPEINVQDWKNYTKLEGFDDESMGLVNLFWTMCSEMTFIERSKLLQFVTGTTCIPNEGFEGFYPNFTLCRLRKDETYLPVAHTCLNRLDLPDYTTLEKMKERFKSSIEFGLKEGFQLH
jgi:E3 ubiquitin-protein ligase HUWE1